jgi:hypothetical protein
MNVLTIQRKLNLLNAGLKEDGILGNKTKFWIYAVQNSSKNLDNDGVYGVVTNTYVDSIIGKKGVYTNHFKKYECDCHHCGRNIGMDINVLILAEGIRFKFGNKPIAVSSGYRCSTHNNAVGGGTKSQHLYGRALDIVVTGVSASRVYAVANVLNVKGGVGSPDYINFTHIDSRKTKARW